MIIGIIFSLFIWRFLEIMYNEVITIIRLLINVYGMFEIELSIIIIRNISIPLRNLGEVIMFCYMIYY